MIHNRNYHHSLREPAGKIDLHSSEGEASVRPSNCLLDRLLKCLSFFRMNHLHIMGFVGPHAVAEVEIERPASLRPSRKLIISASSLLPLFITIGSDFSTIVSIDRVSGQHADQSKWLTDAEMCICSGGRRTGIGSSPISPLQILHWWEKRSGGPSLDCLLRDYG